MLVMAAYFYRLWFFCVPHCLKCVLVKVKEKRQRSRHFSWHRLSECFQYCQLWFSTGCELVHSSCRPVSCRSVLTRVCVCAGMFSLLMAQLCVIASVDVMLAWQSLSQTTTWLTAILLVHCACNHVTLNNQMAYISLHTDDVKNMNIIVWNHCCHMLQN